MTSLSTNPAGLRAPIFWRRATWSILLLASIASSMQAQQPSMLDKARAAIDANQYTVAEQLCRKALAQDPKSVGLMTTLGYSLHLQGRSAEAIYYFSMALKQGYAPEIYALLAAEKCKMGDFDGARPMLGKIYRQERKNLRVISVVAPCYLDIDEPVESVMVYQEVLGDKDYPADLALVMLAKSYVRSAEFFSGKLSKAPGKDPFFAALRLAPSAGSSAARSAFPLAARISPYFSPDLSWPEAVARWRQHPQDTALLYLLSVLSSEGGIREIQICAERFPDSPYLQQFMADVLADQQHEDEAIAQYEQLIRDHPELPDLQFGLGMIHMKREQWKEAAEEFWKQLASYPTDERAAKNLSYCMLNSQQYTELRAFLQPRMRSEHPPEWVSLDLAETERQLGNVQAAIQILVTAEHQGSVGKLVHYRLMHLYSISDRPDDAKREASLFQAASQR